MRQNLRILILAFLLVVLASTRVQAAPGGTSVKNFGRAEVKFRFVAETPLESVLAAALIQESLGRARAYVLFDTARGSMLSDGVQLRVRFDLSKNKADSTVKKRGMDSDELAVEWRSHDGVKCELNVLPLKEISACSLTQSWDVSDSHRKWVSVLSAQSETELGSRAGSFLTAYFNTLQDRFLEDVAHRSIRSETESLQMSCFSHVTQWEMDPSRLATEGEVIPEHPIVVEQWKFSNRRPTLEISWRVPAEERDRAVSLLKRWFLRSHFHYEEDPLPSGGCEKSK